MSGSEIELSIRSQSESFVGAQASVEENEVAPSNAVSLPPVDTGFQAWAYLANADIRVIPGHTLSRTEFSLIIIAHKCTMAGVLAIVGSVSSGLLYLSSIVILLLVNRYPWYKRQVMVFGLAIAVAGLVGAAYSTEPWQLVLTQGVMYSLGGSLLYFPMTTWMFEWFSAKKGLAAGIIFSGTGVGGVIMPFVVERLLNAYGHKTTLLAMAVASVAFTLPCFPYLKPRLPVAQIVGPRSFDTRFTRSGPFWILFVPNSLQGLASLIPPLYIPTFASDLDLSSTSGTLVLSVLYGASAPGYIFMGWLSDRFDLRYSILLSSIGSALAVLLLWGLSEGLPLLVVFACVYGFLASSWPALWTRFSTITSEDPHQASSVWSIFCAGKGIGSVLSAPIASSLPRTWYFTGRSDFAYSVKGYGPLIIFTGLSLLFTSSASLYRSSPIPRRLADFFNTHLLTMLSPQNPAWRAT
ncbi:mfs monocarboxylate [Moniliophthora roreri MCA 2997]|uniref:Mfs monocarboxylate n=1 Tax=Moniliophthora roreri (strain MCA 2997) TaxID=1381753 RepID=V2XAU8_MONRO|nr:mfs monocarboxylate [Moniliophthora roreri MCA 2997]